MTDPVTYPIFVSINVLGSLSNDKFKKGIIEKAI